MKNDTWSYVEGSTPRLEPLEGDQTRTAAITAWDAVDLKAQSDLFLSISPLELKQIKGCVTANSICLVTFQSTGPQRKSTLLKQSALQKIIEGEDWRDHMKKNFNIIFEEIFCEKKNASTPLGIEPRSIRLPVECSVI